MVLWILLSVRSQSNYNEKLKECSPKDEKLIEDVTKVFLKSINTEVGGQWLNIEV